MLKPEILAEARSWLGVPFRHLGRNRQGVDCAGLVIAVGIALGDEHLASVARKLREYDWEPTEPRARAMLALAFEPKVAAPEPGDVGAFFLHTQARRVTHVGIITDLHGGLGLIHASGAAKKVVEHTIDAEWLGRLAGLYTYHGVC